MSLHLTLKAGPAQATLRLPDDAASPPAIDVIMALADPAADLVQRGWLDPAGVSALTAIQGTLFDRDAEGPFVREGVDLQGPAGSLDPDAPLQRLLAAGPAGEPALTIAVVTPATDRPEPPAAGDEQAETMARFQTLFVLFKLAEGALIDVTKDDPFLIEPLRRLEREKWITINVDKAAWELTPAGHAEVAQVKQEARQLITRFDIFADVDDTGSEPRFGLGAGDDWRIPAYEMAGIDPFHARFILGLNDGEWANLADWPARTAGAEWYDAVFEPVSGAPDADTIGRARLKRVMQAGSDLVHETLDEERQAGIDPLADRIPNPYRDGTL
jgi:hypothetical protein